MKNVIRLNRIKRHVRVRAKVKGTKECPRLSVFRSINHIYAQLIDDDNSKTLAQFSDLVKKGIKAKNKTGGITKAKDVGKTLGGEIIKKGFTKIVFDRGGYKYHGRVQALADGLRESGVKF
ncbi:MAG: 50S ribosomal protein L18 [bacterium]|nr:50S ribosomal protein L18 [bacterium]